MILLDTHALLWLVRGEVLKETATAAVRAAQDDGRLYVSAISAWELGLAELKRRDRPELGLPAGPWFRRAMNLTGALLAPIALAVSAQASTVPAIYGSGDPGDCFIIATARIRQLTVMTRDRRMIALAASEPHDLRTVEC